MERYFQDDKKMKTFLRMMPFVMALTACGGSEDSSNATPINPIINPIPPVVVTECLTPKILQNGVCVSVANICQTETEKVWVRAHLDDVYLWYNEIKDVGQSNYSSPQSYFDALLVKSKDRFSFVANQAEIEAFQESGLNIGYGITWVNDPAYNNGVRIAFVEKNSPADLQGLERGYILMTIDGKALSQFTQEEFVEALYPDKVGVTHTFEISSYINPKTIFATLTSKEVAQNPVPIVSTQTVANKKIGYLLFNDHNALASDKLVNAMTGFKNQKIDELVIDLRYNSGGFLYIASQLASMVAGSNIQYQVFASFMYNDKNYSQNSNYYFPPFDDQRRLLPQLNLKRVFVLTGQQTCSSSEAFINALSPFVDVVMIGSSSTCGKPYGFQQENNCASTYFAVRYQNVNALGQSVPTVGYAPRCRVEDNLGFALGDTQEVMFNSAMYYMNTNTCPVWSFSQSSKKSAAFSLSPKEVYRAPWRSNMIIKQNN